MYVCMYIYIYMIRKVIRGNTYIYIYSRKLAFLKCIFKRK